MIKLGSFVKDQITTVEGVAVSRLEYLNGCVRYEVQPQELKDGKPVSSTWVDYQQLEVIHEAKTEDVKDRPGGPRDNPPRREPSQW